MQTSFSRDLIIPRPHRGCRNTRRPLVGWLVITACGLFGCNAGVRNFDVAPRHSVCPGTPVTIVWDVVGDASLTVSPAVAGAPDGPVSSSDHATIVPNGKTVVSLRVTRCFGEPTGRDFDVSPAGSEEVAASLSDTSSCQDGVLTVKAHTQKFDNLARAHVVGSPKRSIEISRDQPTVVRVSIPKGGTTDKLAAFPANGDWTVSTKLEPSETCKDPPSSVTFVVYTTCEGAK